MQAGPVKMGRELYKRSRGAPMHRGALVCLKLRGATARLGVNALALHFFFFVFPGHRTFERPDAMTQRGTDLREPRGTKDQQDYRQDNQKLWEAY